MYGWAWILRLAAELRSWDDADGQSGRNPAPLEHKIAELTKDYLPRLNPPDSYWSTSRYGIRPRANVLHDARAVGDTQLEKLVTTYAREKYLDDHDYPGRFEPSGEDFFSPAWNEADLIRRILPKEDFPTWLEHFLPGLGNNDAGIANLVEPVVVSDVSDPKIVHLAGSICLGHGRSKGYYPLYQVTMEDARF